MPDSEAEPNIISPIQQMKVSLANHWNQGTAQPNHIGLNQKNRHHTFGFLAAEDRVLKTKISQKINLNLWRNKGKMDK